MVLASRKTFVDWRRARAPGTQSHHISATAACKKQDPRTPHRHPTALAYFSWSCSQLAHYSRLTHKSCQDTTGVQEHTTANWQHAYCKSPTRDGYITLYTGVHTVCCMRYNDQRTSHV